LIGSVKPPQTVLLPRAENTVGNGRFVMLETLGWRSEKCWLMMVGVCSGSQIFPMSLVVPMFFQMVCGELGELLTLEVAQAALDGPPLVEDLKRKTGSI